MKRILAKETMNYIGKEVMLNGWVDTKRDHGKLTFIDVRDRSGVVQVVGGKELKGLKAEDVVSVTGTVVKRLEGTENKELETGSIEIQAQEVKVISSATTLPFPINTDGYDIEEELRLKYRYLDLRRERMTRNMRVRFETLQFIRNYLMNVGFVEIETPILTKTTPEGARDFIVPSRLQPGNFYALPQSPQQYKQLLMVAGFERYFQIARCFRDEDPRKDRAYGEFTQLDMELSFVTQEDILQLVEHMFTRLVEELFPEKHITTSPWPRIPHEVAVETYGTDKPDLRKDTADPNELAFSWTVDFPLFTKQSEEDYFHGSGKAKFAPSHHMFTSPHLDDIPLLETDPMRVRGLQHDLVLNGFEVGGGSIRIHDPRVQNKVFDLIGFSEAQKTQFAHMLNAFSYGVPPHGGIAPGIDRLLMTILGEPSVREVIAYPTMASGRTAVVEAPSDATEEQLRELSISVVRKTYASVYEHIIDLLKENKIKYQQYVHESVFTSEEAAKARGTSLHQGAKALVLQTDKELVLYVVPADERADLNAVKKYLKVKRVAMASKDTVMSKTGLEAGALPPFGSTMGLKTYVSPSLAENKEIVFNAGRHDRSIKMMYQDLVRLEKPQVIDIG